MHKNRTHSDEGLPVVLRDLRFGRDAAVLGEGCNVNPTAS